MSVPILLSNDCFFSTMIQGGNLVWLKASLSDRSGKHTFMTKKTKEGPTLKPNSPRLGTCEANILYSLVH